MSKITTINKEHNSLIPFEGTKGGIWDMTKPKSRIRGISFNGIDQYGKLTDCSSIKGLSIAIDGINSLNESFAYLGTDYEIDVIDGTVTLGSAFSNATIYVDNISSNTITVFSKLITIVFDAMDINDGFIGYNNVKFGNFNLTNVRAFTSVLTQDEMAQLYNNGRPDKAIVPSDCILDLNFSEYNKGDKYILDHSGNNNHCELVNNPDEYVGKYLIEENKIKDVSGANMDLQIYGEPEETYLGSLKGLFLNKNNLNEKEWLKSNYKLDEEVTFGVITNYYSSVSSQIIGFATDNNYKFGIEGEGNSRIYFRHGNTSGVLLEFKPSNGLAFPIAVLLENSYKGYANGKYLGIVNGSGYSQIIGETLKLSRGCLGGACGEKYLKQLIAYPFIIPKALSDSEIKNISDRLLYLAKNMGVWSGVGDNETEKMNCDLEDSNFIGTIYQEQGDYALLPNAPTKVDDAKDFRYYDSDNNLIYAPLPITMKDDMINDLDISGNKVYGATDKRQFELGLDKLMFTNQKISQEGIAISTSGANVAVASLGDVIYLKLVEPESGRVLGYTRERIDDTHYNHRFYVNDAEVDAILNSTEEFMNSSNCDLPIDVSGSKMTISPSDYILDDLIIDGQKYTRPQFRSLFLADSINDSLNEKIIIAGVRNFTNEIIYSVEDATLPEELLPIAEANREIKKVTKYTAD